MKRQDSVKKIPGGWHAVTDEMGNVKRAFRSKAEADALDGLISLVSKPPVPPKKP